MTRVPTSIIAGALVLVAVSTAPNVAAGRTQEIRKMVEHNADTATKRNLVVTRTFDAPLDQVWKAWSDAEQVMRWWGPKNFTSPSCAMDFRVGSRALVCMRAPQDFGGFDMYNTWNYRKIEPMERIEFVLNFTDKEGNKLNPAQIGMPPGIPEDVPHVITFKALGDGRTEITVTESGYTSDDVVELSRQGLEECLDKMAGTFSNK